MKQLYASFHGLTPLVALAALAGCSGGLNGPSSPTDENSNTSLPTRGIVSTANELSVNGEPLSLQAVTVLIDGQPGSASALQDGMWVNIEWQDGVIQSISYEEDVKGPIDIVELDGSLSVLGQLVHISSSTFFDDSTPGLLKSGDVVEVSGVRDSNDLLAASRIELKKSTTSAWSVRGYVRNLDRSRQSFTIGNLTVDYSQARLDDMSVSSLGNGVQVEVKDESRSYESGSLYLLATKIEKHDEAVRYPSSDASSSVSSDDDSSNPSVDSSTADGDDSGNRSEVEIEGIVTGFDSTAGTLEVEGFEVTTSNATEYQEGYDQYVTRMVFFARLRKGVSVVKVKWRSFTGYDQPPHELELET